MGLPLHHASARRGPPPLRAQGRNEHLNYATAFDRAAKLLRSFCSFGGITAMQ
jgi:hypothetical protein